MTKYFAITNYPVIFRSLNRYKMETLTASQIKKTQVALKETKDCLERATRYSADLQDVKYINFLNGHILKLENMLITKTWELTF